MAGKIDKTRSEKKGEVSYTGTGVGTIPDVMEEQKDLLQQMQDMINEAMSSVTGGTTIAEPDQISNVTNVIGKGVTWNQLENALNQIIDVIRTELSWIYQVQANFRRDMIDLQRQIDGLQSGVGSGVQIFRYSSRSTTVGTYHCVKLKWGYKDGAYEWLEPDAGTHRCKNILEDYDWVYYESTVFFMSVGPPVPDDSGNYTYPVMPLRGVIQKAYVKTTPGDTATMACYLGKDINGSPTPSEINVACYIDGGGFLNACVPSLVDGDYFWVQNILGTWRNVTPFMAAESCP